MAVEARHGGRRAVCVRAPPFLGAHILVPVATGLEMGPPGQLMLGGGVAALVRGAVGGACPILIPFAWMPVVMGMGGMSFLPRFHLFHLFLVVKLIPPHPRSWSTHLSSRSFCTAASVYHSLYLPEFPSPFPSIAFPAHSMLRRSRTEEGRSC